MSSIFELEYNSFNIEAAGIRNCQRGAYYAILAHFTRSRKPCLVGLPTGSGKTALMMALCFGLKVNRALIITPATILRFQTAEKFKTLDDLTNTNAIPKEIRQPNVLEAVHEFQSLDDWNSCVTYDVVVATPNASSPEHERVSPPPKGLFDLLIIDEAHHSPASTWKALINTFWESGTKTILLTGTPYRRDHIEISADLVYDYPIARAIEDEIYSPVKFVNARKSTKNRDQKLAQAASVERDRMKDAYGSSPLLLIKTDRKKHANELCNIYQEQNLTVAAIHTDFSDQENRDTLTALKSGKLDGVVAVGMIGEGLDVPSLKLAVFHRNPQSLPHTIQVIGRLSRSGTNIKEGVVIGYSDDFSRETFSLYDASPDWLRLIPELERKLISGRVGSRNTLSLMGNENFLFEPDINPYFSISAFKWNSRPSIAQLDAVSRWERHTKERSDTLEKISLFEIDTVVAVTKTIFQPDWIKSGGYSRIYQERFDLHVFFQYKELVLEYSTDPQIAWLLRNRLFTGQLKYIDPSMLNHALESGDGAYLVVGLKNSAGFYQGVPSYKMLLGTEVQAGITISDTKVFHAGHCLMRVNREERDSEIRGIAYKKGRIWSLRRDNLRAFREWCFNLAEVMLDENKAYLPGLEMLRKTEQIYKFTERPLALVHNPYLFTRKVKFIKNDAPEALQFSGLPNMTITNWTKSSITFSIQDLGVAFKINLDIFGDISFEKTAGIDYTVIVDGVDGVIKNFSINEFFEEFSPRVLFPDGSTLVDGLYSKPAVVPELPQHIFLPIDWTGCDIYSEINKTDDGNSVQGFIEQQFVPHRDPNLLIIHDHQAREIADAISIDMDRKAICLYHMKSARILGGKKQLPGSRKADLEPVIAQAFCSGYWIRNIDFANELVRHVRERAATRILHGSQAHLAAFAEDYAPPLYSFEIAIVQPAFRVQKITHPIKDMLAGAYDYLNAVSARLIVICNE